MQGRIAGACRRPGRRARRGRARRRSGDRRRASRCCSIACRASTRTASCARFIGVIGATLRTSFYQTAADGAPARLHQLQVRSGARCRTCPSRGRTARSSSTRRASKACTCASARSRAAACAGRIGARISAPRCWAWSRRRWSRTPSSCRSARRAASSSSGRRSAAIAMRSSPKASPATGCSSTACSTSPTTSSTARSSHPQDVRAPRR